MKFKELLSGAVDVTTVDESGGKNPTVKTVWNKTDIIDLDKDLILPSAFNKSISDRANPNSRTPIYHLIDHKFNRDNVVGVPSELYMNGTDLTAVTEIKMYVPMPDGTFQIDQKKLSYYNSYKSGEVKQHSIGFDVIKGEKRKDYYEIQEVKLYEGSAVLLGANPLTPTQSVKGLMKFVHDEEIFKEFQSSAKKLLTVKRADLNDEDLYFIGLQYSQLIESYKSMVSQNVKENTLPSEDTKPNIEKAFLESFYNVIIKSTQN